jgi:hypothetical protein
MHCAWWAGGNWFTMAISIKLIECKRVCCVYPLLCLVQTNFTRNGCKWQLWDFGQPKNNNLYTYQYASWCDVISKKNALCLWSYCLRFASFRVDTRQEIWLFLVRAGPPPTPLIWTCSEIKFNCWGIHFSSAKQLNTQTFYMQYWQL